MAVIARVSKRYQVVIPKEVRKKLGIKEGEYPLAWTNIFGKDNCPRLGFGTITQNP